MSVDSFTGPDSLPVESAERIDRICDRFEAAWRNGEKPSIDDHIADSTEPERSILWRELVTIEVQYRRMANDEPTINEYESRFPEQRQFLQVLLSAHTPGAPSARGSKTPMAFSRPENGQPASATNHEEPSPNFGDGVATGSTLGDYVLLDKIGTGGMGLVYRARQQKADRVVAVKVIRPRVADELSPGRYREWLERFEREAKLTAALEHDDIVPIYDVGDANGQPYYAMRFVDGQSLADVIRQGPIPDRRAAKYLERVARAVHFAHQRGVFHRDLKPGNILIDRADRPYVSDFGLAKWVEGVGSLTETGACVGSPPYMSPEQIQDASRVTAASDVYSLGATLYDALTGRPPFKAARVAETLNQVIHSDPVPPRQLNSAIDLDLETITLKCLRKDPGLRYQTAQELADDLARYLDHQPIHARSVHWTEKTWRWARRNPITAVLASTAFALLLSLVAVMSVGYWTVLKAWKETADERDHARKVTRAALLDEARALRFSTEGGRRWKALDALRRAAAIRPGVDLRDEYIRCLDTADIRLLGHFSLDKGRDRTLEMNLNGVGRLMQFPAASAPPIDSRHADRFEEISVENELLWTSPDSRYYVLRSRTNKHIVIWDWNSDRVRVELKDEQGVRTDPELLTFSAQSDLVAFAYAIADADGGRMVKIVRLTDEAAVVLGTWDVGAPGVDCLRFNPAGTLLAAGSNLSGTREREYGIRLWDVAQTKELAPLALEQSTGWNAELRAPHRIAFSADGRLLAATRGTVRLWSIGKTPAREVWSQSLQAHPADVVHVLPTSRWLVTIDRVGQLKLWDALGSGELVTCIGRDWRPVGETPEPFSIPAHARLLSHMTGGPIAGTGIWEWAPAISQTLLPQESVSANPVRPDHFALAFSPDERWLAYSCGANDVAAPYCVDLNNLASPPVSMHERGSPPRLLAFSPDSNTLWSAGRSRHTTWLVPSGDSTQFPSSGLTIASAYAGNERVVASLRQMVQLTTFDLANGAEIWGTPPYPASAMHTSRPVYSSDNATLITGSRSNNGTPSVSTVVSNARTGEALHEREGGTGHFFFRDGEPLSLMDTRALTLRNLRTDELLDSLMPDDQSPATNYDRFAKFAFSDDGRVCAEFGLSGDIVIWDIGGKERKPRCLITRHRPESFADQDLRAFNSDGSKIAAFDSKEFLKVWDTRTGQEIGRLKLLNRPEFFAFDADGERLLVVHLGEEVRIWLPGEKEYKVMTRLTSDSVLDKDRAGRWWNADNLLIDNALQISADRKRLVYVSRPTVDGCHTVYVWRMSDGSLMTHRIPWQGTGWPRVAVNADGTQLAVVGSWGEVEFRNLDRDFSYTRFRWSDWSLENRLDALSKLYSNVRLSSDGAYAAWCEVKPSSCTIRVVDLANVVDLSNATEIFTSTTERPVSFIALSTGARKLAVGFGAEVQVYDPHARQRVATFSKVSADETVFSGDGGLAATASLQNGTVNLWNAAQW